MANEFVDLTYEREGAEETFEGEIKVDDLPVLTFVGSSFEKMLGSVQAVLKGLPERRLLIRRRKAPYPVSLPLTLEKLIREDLPAAIAALSPKPIKVVVRPEDEKRTKTAVLRSGHDTLADALGDVIYARAKRSKGSGLQVESPFTGRWTACYGYMGVTYCDGLVLTVVQGERLWVTFSTQSLLEEGLQRYYLPRGWNAGTHEFISQGWITHDYLKTLYEKYQQEKASVSNQ